MHVQEVTLEQAAKTVKNTKLSLEYNLGLKKDI